METLCACLGEETSSESHCEVIREKYCKLKKSVKSFSFEGSPSFRLAKGIDQAEEIAAIESLLRWMKLCRGYPKALASSIFEEVKLFQNFIVADLPEERLACLNRFLNSFRRQEDEEEAENEESMATPDRMGASKSKDEISNIRSLIVELNFLEKVGQIQEVHGDKISNGMKMVDFVIQRNMDNLKKTKEAFENNDIPYIRNAIQESNRKIKKLESIVGLMGDGEIQRQFEDKKTELFESITEFFLANSSIIGDLNLANLKMLSEALSELEKFNLIEGLNSLLEGMPNLKAQFKERTDELIKKIEDPVSRFEADLNSQNQRIWPNIRILENYYRYVETSGNRVKSFLDSKVRVRKYLDLQLAEKMETPFEEFRTKVEEIVSLEEDKITQLNDPEGFLASKKIENMKKILIVCREILESERVRDIYGEEVEDIVNTFKESYSSLSERFWEKLRLPQTLNNNVIQTLKQIAERLQRLGGFH